MSKTNCSIRLQELNDAAKPAPTRLEGSQVALGNVIRRRVASIRKKTNSDNQRVRSYGPLFGLAKKPTPGQCDSIFTANSGNSSDVTEWRRLYGGSRNLFSTSSCKFSSCACYNKDSKTCNKTDTTLS